MFQKIWDRHTVHSEPGKQTILYIDLHLVHEVTSAQAFEGLRLAKRKARRPERTIATPDHNVPTTNRGLPIADPIARQQVDTSAPIARSSEFDFTTWTTINKGSSTSSAPSLATLNLE